MSRPSSQARALSVAFLSAVTASLVCAATVSATPLTSPAVIETPGVQIIIEHEDGSASKCTAGPAVTLPTEERAFITSGHCGKNGDRVSFVMPDSTVSAVASIDRQVEMRIDGMMHDYSIIRLPTGSVSPVIGGRYRQHGAMSMDELSALNAHTVVELCSIGTVSGERCGNLVAVNRDAGELVADFHSINGDSGGPVFIRDGDDAIVVGILLGYRTDASADSVIVPIELMQNTYGLTLTNP